MDETVDGGVADTQECNSSAGDSKWSKNGYGEGVPRQKTGKFSKEESEIVRKAVEDYCALKQISVARLCSECDHKSELKGAWMEIAKRLPHRTVQSVYRHGLRQLHPFKRGGWSEDECETLIDLVHRHGKKWATIQQKLNRSADSCRDKYREMSDDFVKGRWRDNETEILKRLIREHLNADPTADIKELGKMVEREGIKISWSIISKRMGKRSRLSCFKKWQKMTGIISPSDTSMKLSKDDGDDSSASGSSAPRSAADTSTPIIESHSLTTKAQPATHSAPTAGAAAAMAAAAASGHHVMDAGQDATNADFDLYLLSELSSLGVSRSSEINWEGLRIENAQERWNELLEEFYSSTAEDDCLITLPLSEIAQLLLDRKTSAQRAAETVEAVDLPAPEALNAREV